MIVPPASRAADWKPAKGNSSTSSRRSRLRPRSTGESGSGTGASILATDRPKRAPAAAVCSWSTNRLGARAEEPPCLVAARDEPNRAGAGSASTNSTAVRTAVATAVEHRAREIDATDAIGDGVMELQHERGPATLETFDECAFPLRPSRIENRCRPRCAQVQHACEGQPGVVRAHGGRGSRARSAGSSVQLTRRSNIP